MSLERLKALTLTHPQRIGLSATQRPIETIVRFLVGNRQTVQPPLFTGLMPDGIEWCHRRLLPRIGLTQEVMPSVCDPLNLACVILPGPRMPAVPTNRLVCGDGVVVRAVLGRGAAD